MTTSGPALAAALAAFLGSAAWASARAADGDAPPLARASVDHGLFRDGEVRRRNQLHGSWSLDCDEVPRLAQRFCSLRSLGRDGRGAAVVRITISTDQGGRPAALLELPLSTDLRQPVTVTAANALVVGNPTPALLDDARRRAGPASARGKPGTPAQPGQPARTDVLHASLGPDLCDASQCYAVWPLTPSDVAALRAGAGLRIAFQVVTSSAADLASGRPPAKLRVDAMVSSEGFNEGILSSVR